MQVGTCGGEGGGAVVSACVQPRVEDPLILAPGSLGWGKQSREIRSDWILIKLAPGSLGWAALSIFEPSTIKKKPSSPASWESTCGEEVRGAVLSVCMQGAPSSRASSESTCTAEIAISLKLIRGHQRPSGVIRGHQSSESTCTAEMAISLKLGTRDASSGHLRSISHGMFDSLKRPSSGLVLRPVTAAPSAVASISSRVSTYS